MKGEQLSNFIEHHLSPYLDPETGTPGEISSPSSPGLSPRVPASTGCEMDSETQVYRDWANRARRRRGIPVNGVEWNPPLSEIGDAEEILDDPLEGSSPVRDAAREKKQRKLWAYRQRTMSWANPYAWTRASFRRKLNARFVESLMMWPPYWTSDQAVLGPEVMASWRSKALSHLSSLLGELSYDNKSHDSPTH